MSDSYANVYINRIRHKEKSITPASMKKGKYDYLMTDINNNIPMLKDKESGNHMAVQTEGNENIPCNHYNNQDAYNKSNSNHVRKTIVSSEMKEKNYWQKWKELMNVYEEAIITLLNYLSETVDHTTFDSIKKKMKSHCDVSIGKGKQVESYHHLQSILDKAKYSDRNSQLVRNLSNGSPKNHNSVNNSPTNFQLHQMKGKELKLSLHNIHSTKHQSQDNLYSMFKRNKTTHKNGFAYMNINSKDNSESETRKNNDIPISISPNINHSSMNYHNHHSKTNKAMMTFSNANKSPQLTYHFKTPQSQTISSKPNMQINLSPFNYFSNLIKRTLPNNQINPSPQLSHCKSIKFNTLPQEINLSPIKALQGGNSIKSLFPNQTILPNPIDHPSTSIEIDPLKDSNVKLLSQVKSSLDENLKVMFNFSYENFLNKESGRESKISNED